MKRSDKARADASKVADLLDDISLPRQASAVRLLVRSAASSCGTLKVLHRDNMALRDRIAELERRN